MFENKAPAPIPANLDKRPGETIREWRKFRGLTQVDLAQKVKPPIRQTFLSSIEVGAINSPNPTTVIRIAKALDISPGHILCRIGPAEATFEQPTTIKTNPNRISREPVSQAVLDALIKSKTRQRLLKFFFESEEEREAHVRELVRITGDEINAVRRELTNLTEAKLVAFRREENKVVYYPTLDPALKNKMAVLFGDSDPIAPPEPGFKADLSKRPGEVTREWREHLGLTMTALAAKAGPPVSKQYLSQLENGKITSPGVEHILKLAQALGISPEHILLRVGPQPIRQEASTPHTLEVNWDITPGQTARAWMEHQQIRVSDLAAKLGLGDGYLSLVLNGKVKNPGDEKIKALAGALDIPPAYLLLRQTPKQLGFTK